MESVAEVLNERTEVGLAFPVSGAQPLLQVPSTVRILKHI